MFRLVSAGLALAGLLVAVPSSAPVSAQVRPIYSRGVAGLVQTVERLLTTASAMHTGAHPDDEDTAFIARAARGDHARVAYLSLNRGEGGQNLIGLELFDALGVIRTEELLQARVLDGGDQFFTRAYDFGFTKTIEEAADKWDKERILGDMVRAIRTYRPLVLFAGFSGTNADGHGQHQLSGVLTPIAFEAAADPKRFPEQIAEGLRPWQPKKLYVRQGFGRSAAEPTLRLPTGVFDPLLGRSFFEIAMEGRSQHKSQEMGVVEARGPKTSNMRLVSTLAGTNGSGAVEKGVFDGIDTSLAGIASLAGLPAGALMEDLALIEAKVKAVLADPNLLRDPARVASALVEGLAATGAALRKAEKLDAPGEARAEAAFLLRVKVAQFEEALVRAAGVVTDVLANREVAAAGDTVLATVSVFVPDGSPVTIVDTRVQAPAAWTVTAAPAARDDAGDNPFARMGRETPTKSAAYAVRVAPGEPPTQPYWLVEKREKDVFTWKDVPARLHNLPFAPPLVAGHVDLIIAGQPLAVSAPLEYRYADSVRGEIRRSFAVAPPVTLAFDEPLHVVPAAGASKPRKVAVRLQSQTLSQTGGQVRLIAPAGWKVEPAEVAARFEVPGERQAVLFTVTPPPGVTPGAYPLDAEARVGGAVHRLSQRVIDYPHIQKHRLYEPARAVVRVLDVKVAPVRVGYVMGAGDQVPEAIRRLGLDVTLLTDDQLASADLSIFDVIVVGIRASEGRPAFVANNGRLIQYARDGGTLVVQYQQPDYVARGLVPFKVEMSRGVRVTDERAPITLLEPQHPAFTFPNRITSEDWEGWVQERNLYALSSFAPDLTPLIETADPSEPPQRGGQVYGRLGKGQYVYTSFAWFRQLPAGVPGAYRLFANLLSLPKAPRAAGPGPR
jgi:LmbE family N-acetylglucosaminyl deacetylase